MSALDDLTQIAQLIFKLYQVTGERMVLHVTTELGYAVTLPDRKLDFNWNNAADALAFLSSLDGNPRQIAERVKAAKVEALTERIARDQKELEGLSDGLQKV